MYDLIDVRMTRTGPHGPVDVLRDIDLHVPTGQVVAVHGSDVAARAALVRVLTGLERPSSGSVRFNDESLAVMTTKRLAQVRARELGLVPHPPRLLDRLTAEENVELGLARQGVDPADRRQRTDAALAAVGLGTARHSYPTQLSEEDRQRVAVARAIAAGAVVLVVEEPTPAVMLILVRLSRTMRITVVVTTQDETVAARATSVHRLDRGRIEQQEASRRVAS
ncbi:putative ABC transport system ATP-binding protein/D-methionine transport system ATP-binding protein [Georgenia soli]|uniref:Putative ABC transport system ATP-binding protein/D-methionine transport system ATP-binding protein n=1 Tax=Georgenia soli TaxID=638953 RepID=A0A2A9ENL8_9MICO|nr:ATP-binding cassette domain-containing protein [Georgenia soli]PFG39852.1 putative ABC transport system ATP-binding protein/D-methionine transport system ATP-binding protein [Georgenia soli]